MANNNMEIKQARIDEIIGFKNNNIISNVSINNTLKIQNTGDIKNSSTITGNVYIRDRVTKTKFGNLSNRDGLLYFGNDGNEYSLINNENIVSEINNAFYPSTSNLTVSNISVLGGDNSNFYGHINFTGNGSAGIRYNKNTNSIEKKHNNTDEWSVIDNLKTNINDPAVNEILQYNNSNQKWENKTNVVLPGTLTINGILDTNDSNDTLLIRDSNNKEIVKFNGGDNTDPVNYLQINSSDTSEALKIEALGDDNNVDIELASKGTGEIYLNTNRVDLGGTIKSSVSSVSTTDWTAGSSNSIDLVINNDIIVFNMTGKSNGVYYCTMPDGLNGQHVHLVFNKDTSSNIQVKIDFGANKLTTGGGFARYLRFSQSGQTASLVYITESLDRWSIKNTGADVDDEVVGDLGGNFNNTIKVLSTISTNSGSPTSIGPDANILYINLSGKSTGIYYTQMTSSVTGQHINIVFNRGTTAGVSARIDFGSDGLITGGGYARYITLNNNGQAISIIYVGEGLNKWQILNTGATIS